MLKITDLNNKFKDRTPQETIAIIQNYFKSVGLETRVIAGAQTESRSFWCRVCLYQNGIAILGTNGKGTTEIYSLASGLAELYERYCGGFALSPLQSMHYFSTQKQNHTYFYDANEKFLTFDEIKNSCTRIQHEFDFINDDENEILKSFADIYSIQNCLPCVEFKNMDINLPSKYFNPYMLTRMFGSDGMSTGNTIEEAITQGLSEVYEHYAQDLLYDKIQDTYYELDIDNMNLPYYIINMIQGIRSSGDEIHFYDLSYNFGYPVILGVLINATEFNWNIDLGANPIFEIALERVITEMYQGRGSSRQRLTKTYMKPNRNYDPDEAFFEECHSFTLRSIYPEEILLNAKLISNYNTDIFLENKAYTNKELNDYFIALNKKYNFDVYIYDASRSKDIKSVRVFVANQDVFDWRYKIYNNINVEKRKLILKYTRLTLNLYYQAINNNIDFDIETYKIYSKVLTDLIFNDKDTIKYCKDLIEILVAGLDALVYNYADCKTLLNNCNDYIKGVNEINSFYDYKIINYYNTLFYYITSNKYTAEEIYCIINKCKFNVIKENFDLDYQNIQNFNYLFLTIMFTYALKLYDMVAWEEITND